MKPPYATREAVRDASGSSFLSSQVDRALYQASRAIDAKLNRKFYPELTTKFFDTPRPFGRTWRLWLEGDAKLIDITSVTSGGTALASNEYFLEPANEGPPYNSIEINRALSGSFNTGSTFQRNVEVVGLWGYQNDELSLGTITSSPSASDTTISTSNPVAVGSLLRIGSERLLVTENSFVDTTNDVTLTARSNDQTFAVSDGTEFFLQEVLSIGAELVRITKIVGNDLTVDRAVLGSTLAAHTSENVLAIRSVTASRGVLGTTATSHTSGAAVALWRPPSLVENLCIAEALHTINQELSGYARVAGAGENQREVTGRGLYYLWKEAKVELKRVRKSAV